MIRNILIGVIALLIIAKIFVPSETKREEPPFTPFAVPDFALDTLDGQDKLTLKDLEGEPVLLTFMSYNCGYCTRQSKYMSDNGFDMPVYLISADMDKEGIEKWVKDNNIKPYYKKFGIKGNQVGKNMNVRAVPTSFVVYNGFVVKEVIGAIDDAKAAEIKSFVERVPKFEKDK